MNLYEIETEILSCVDDETGEIIDFEKLEQLNIEKNKKIENLGLWFKNLVADAVALKNEIDVLNERKKRAESKAEQIKLKLNEILNGTKFETSKIKMSYRKSKSVEIDDDFVSWACKNADNLLTFKPPVPDKKAIKDAIEFGNNVMYANLVSKSNLNIK